MNLAVRRIATAASHTVCYVLYAHGARGVILKPFGVKGKSMQ